MAVYEDYTDYTIRAWLQEPVHLPEEGRATVAQRIRETPQQRHWWPPVPARRSQTMFNATKLVVASIVLAIVGGFLGAGVLMQQPSEDPAPAVVTSPTPETTVAATAMPAPTAESEPVVMTRSDLVPGVDLTTEEVEPGVYRVMSDGVRDLSAPVEDFRAKANHIATALDGTVWVFRDQTFFRLGDTDTRSGPWISGADVDTQGNVWALGRRNAKKTFGCSNDAGGPHLLLFDGGKWTAKLCDVNDFQLRSDDSLFVTRPEQSNTSPGKSTPNRIGGQKVTDISEYQIFAASPPSPGVDVGWDSAWVVDDRDRLGLARFSLRTCPPHCTTGDWQDAGPGGNAVAVGFGSDRSSWAYIEFHDPVVVDGVLTTEPADFLVSFAPMPVEPGSHLGVETTGAPDQIGAYPSALGTAHLTRSPRLDVAPDGALWLPTDDGLARFDGETWDWYLTGRAIEDIDISDDGAVWVQANDMPGLKPEGTSSTYVVTR